MLQRQANGKLRRKGSHLLKVFAQPQPHAVRQVALCLSQGGLERTVSQRGSMSIAAVAAGCKLEVWA